VEVEVSNLKFTPSDVTIQVGDKILWTNVAGIHSVTSGADSVSDGHFDSGLLLVGGEFEHTFLEAGSYPYFCTLHASMSGSITVTE